MTWFRRGLAFAACVAATIALVSAQGPPQSADAQLSSARRALAAGQAAAALRTLEPLAAQSPGNRAVAELVIEASLMLKDAARAYATYDAFVQATGTPAAALLKPIALHELRSLVSGAVDDPRLRVEALERLAGAGDSKAGADLRQGSTWPGSQSLLADAALARMGDEPAMQRLSAAAAVSDGSSKTAVVEAIRRAGNAGQAQVLVPLLKHQDPRTRIAAVEALATLGYTGAIPDIQPLLTDPAREVRTAAALALVRLGDSGGRATIDRMLSSPVPDVRLQAAEADRSMPSAQRSAIIRPILRDEDPLNRLKAAEALARDEPETVRPVLIALAHDADFLVRREAGRILENLAPPDIEFYRSLLTDREPWVRMYAAGAVIKAAAAGS
jgi:HEAT repeat protein